MVENILNFKMIVPQNNDHIFDCLKKTKIWKKMLTERFLSDININKYSTFIDIGANIGYYSLIAQANGIKNVYSFEPNDYVFDILRKNNELNNFNIHLFNIGLSDKKDELVFNYAAELGNLNKKIVKPVVLLDDINIDGEKIAIKIDVDSYQYEILMGAEKLFSSGRIKSVIIKMDPFMYGETIEDKILDFLSKHFNYFFHDEENKFIDINNLIVYSQYNLICYVDKPIDYSEPCVEKKFHQSHNFLYGVKTYLVAIKLLSAIRKKEQTIEDLRVLLNSNKHEYIETTVSRWLNGECAPPLTLEALYDRYFMELYIDDPEQLSMIGILDSVGFYEHHKYWTEYPSSNRDYLLYLRAKRTKKHLRLFKSKSLPAKILEWILNRAAKDYEYRLLSYIIEPSSGIQIDMDILLEEYTPKEYLEDRKKRLPQKIDLIIKRLREQLEANIYIPAFLLKKCLPQVSDSKLKKEIEKIIELGTELRGVYSLPNGKDYYKYCLDKHVTIDISPEEIFEMGEIEVSRINKELESLTKICTNKISMKYVTKVIKEADLLMESLFKELPKQKIVIKEVPQNKLSAPAGFYYPPSLNGNIPGTFYISPTKVERDSLKTLIAHEAVPGHHFQFALLNESDLPYFQKIYCGFNAYIEGWAHYAEKLMKDAGYYDEQSLLGHYKEEQRRACRLVVDTGIHWFGWDREQAIHYMKDNGVTSDVEDEVDRYFSIPGQACSYKIGELFISHFKEKHKDIAEFHYRLLSGGPGPLFLLSSYFDN